MKLWKRSVCLLLALTLVLALVGCGQSSQPASSGGEESQEGDTITIVDHNDNTVQVPRDVQRIVVCDILPLPSVLAVFFDSAEKIVGMTDTSMSAAKNGLLGQLYPEILNAETGFISGTEVNIEELMTLDPDVVFYSAASPQLGQQLTEAGFAAVAISANKWDYDCIETLENWFALLGQIFPENDKTELVQSYSQEAYDLVQERVSGLSDEERERVFFLFKYSENSILTSGAHFFGNWWAEAVGAVNVAKELDVDNQAEVNLEQVYAWDPDMILITNFTSAQPQDLYDNTVGSYDWSGVAAVKNQQVYKMPLGMYRSYTPGVDTPVTLLWLAKTVYPDLFADIDIVEKTKDYYKTVFGVELTEEQAASIFAPVSDAAAGF